MFSYLSLICLWTNSLKQCLRLENFAISVRICSMFYLRTYVSKTLNRPFYALCKLLIAVFVLSCKHAHHTQDTCIKTMYDTLMIIIMHVCLITAGLDPHLPKEKVRFAPVKKEAPKPPSAPSEVSSVGKISFEEYHLTWKHIATSKSTDSDKNMCMYSFDVKVVTFAHM